MAAFDFSKVDETTIFIGPPFIDPWNAPFFGISSLTGNATSRSSTGFKVVQLGRDAVATATYTGVGLKYDRYSNEDGTTHRAVDGIITGLSDILEINGEETQSFKIEGLSLDLAMVSGTPSEQKAAALKLFADDDTILGGKKSDLVDGHKGNDDIYGNKGKDTLDGGVGKDTLVGGNGKDTLYGRKGADHFVFDSKLGSANVDRIADFKTDKDVIALDHDIFEAIGSKLNRGEFYAAQNADAAHDRSDRIIYDRKSGKLYYDEDGNEPGGHAAIHFATLDGAPKLHFDDFTIV